MARAIITSNLSRRPTHEPLYDIDPHSGATIEVFYGDAVLARSFGAGGSGWFWWSCRRGRLPDKPPSGPFGTNYLTHRDHGRHNASIRSLCKSFKCCTRREGLIGKGFHCADVLNEWRAEWHSSATLA
jgi:hypothetical protein